MAGEVVGCCVGCEHRMQGAPGEFLFSTFTSETFICSGVRGWIEKWASRNLENVFLHALEGSLLGK